MPTIGEVAAAVRAADEKAKAIEAHAARFDIEELTDAMDDAVIEAADGCIVELDGRCCHGYPSPMRHLGYI